MTIWVIFLDALSRVFREAVDDRDIAGLVGDIGPRLKFEPSRDEARAIVLGRTRSGLRNNQPTCLDGFPDVPGALPHSVGRLSVLAKVFDCLFLVPGHGKPPGAGGQDSVQYVTIEQSDELWYGNDSAFAPSSG